MVGYELQLRDAMPVGARASATTSASVNSLVIDDHLPAESCQKLRQRGTFTFRAGLARTAGLVPMPAAWASGVPSPLRPSSPSSVARRPA